MKISQMHSRQFTDNSGFEVFANPARGTTSMNFSARQVKKGGQETANILYCWFE